MSRLRCFLTPRAWILSSRAENESLGGGLSRTFFAAMRLGEDLGSCPALVLCFRLWLKFGQCQAPRHTPTASRPAIIRRVLGPFCFIQRRNNPSLPSAPVCRPSDTRIAQASCQWLGWASRLRVEAARRPRYVSGRSVGTERNCRF